MDLKIEEIDGNTVAKISGRLDTVAADELEKTLIASISQDNNKIMVDLSDVKFMSSAGLRAIMIIAKKAKSSGGRLTLSGMSENVRLVIDMAGNLSSLLDIK